MRISDWSSDVCSSDLTLGIYEYLDAEALEDHVFGRGIVHVLELVGHARASGGAHAQPQAHALATLLQVAPDVRGRLLGQGNGHISSPPQPPRFRPGLRPAPRACPCSLAPPP